MGKPFKLVNFFTAGIVVILFILTVLFLGKFLFEKTFPYPEDVKFGVSFSPRYALHLNLDWRKTYIDILDQLGVKYLRLPSIWEEIESIEGNFDFSTTDFMLTEAVKRRAKIIQVLGNKQPRWPECHTPDWAKALSVGERQEKILKFIKATVERYQNNPEIEAWQVENEPFLSFFGQDCDQADANFLKREVVLVRSISNKPIIISDSGELGSWIIPMQNSDIFGTTIYRQVYDQRIGYIDYPIPPYLYHIKSQIIKNIFARNNEKTIIVELQTEPWIGTLDVAGDAGKQARLLSLSKLQKSVNFAQKTGFDEIYLWGVEWWYFMAQNGYPEYLEYAKSLF